MNARQLIWVVAVFGLMLSMGIPTGYAVVLEGDGSPWALDPALVGWWKADAGVNLSGTDVLSWDNQALSVGGTATAANANAYPTYLASVSGLNGQPGVYFDRDTEQDRLFSSVVPATGNAPRTMIAVFVDAEGYSNSAYYAHVAHYGSNSTYQAFGIASHTSTQTGVVDCGPTVNIGNHYWGYRGSSQQKPAMNPTVFVSQYDGDLNSFWANGYYRGTVNPDPLNTGSAHGIVLGGIQSQASNEGYKGIIAEVIAYNTTLTDTERQQLEGYLNTKYGLSIPADLSDPFFSIFTYNGDARQASDGTTDVIRLTDSGGYQAGSAFTQMTMATDYSFQASFEFQISLPGGGSDVDGMGADGMAFVIHQDPRGLTALGDLGAGMGFAGTAAITPALAIEIDTYQSGNFDPPSNSTNGNHIAIDVAGVTYSVAQTGVLPRFNDGGHKYGWVDYDGATHEMSVYLSDTDTKPATPILTQQIYLDRIFTGQDVYVGCSAGTGGAVNTHDVYSMGMTSSVSTSTPTPFTPVHIVYNDFSDVSAFTMNGGSVLPYSINNRLRVTESLASQGTSAMLTNPVTLVSDYSFQTEFDFEASLPGGSSDTDGPGADGMTFVIHRDLRGAAAVGGGGGAMGLDGIAPFVAVEFDLWSTGSYDPAAPGNPPTHIGIDTSLNGALVNVAVPRFNDGGVMTAHIEYDGQTQMLDVYLWAAGDTMPTTPTLSTIVDFAAVFGPVDDFYLGFTGGTGGAINQQEILSWEFSSVPEPSTLLLAGLGLLGLVAGTIRRRKKIV